MSLQQQDARTAGSSRSATVFAALRAGGEQLGFTIDETQEAELSAVAASTMKSVQAEGPRHLTETAASGIETLLRSQIQSDTADEIQDNMRQVAEKIGPALTGMGMDESKSKLLSQMMTTVSEKLVRSMQHEGGHDGDGVTDPDGADACGDCPSYLEGVVNEFCARVYMLLYKLALYARPLDELPTYAEEAADHRRKFDAVVQALNGDEPAAASSALYSDEDFQASYIERIRHVHEDEREGAEDQLVLWFENVVKADSIAFKRETMQNWHDACKNHYAFLNSRVSGDMTDQAIRKAIPDIYPLHAAKLMEFWDEEAFASSRTEVLLDLEQINMLSAVSSGLPEPMQRIMRKLTETAAYDNLASEDGNIDQAALMQAAIETVSSLSPKDTLDLMNSIPELLRSLSGPMSSALESVGGMEGAARVLSGAKLESLLGQVATHAGGGGEGAGAGAGGAQALASLLAGSAGQTKTASTQNADFFA